MNPDAMGTLSARIVKVGILSDTHGRLSPAVIRALDGSDLIVHAGDLDHPSILARLQQIAPVAAVRGNMDAGPWADHLQPVARVPVADALLLVLHDLQRLDFDPSEESLAAVVHGHTHRPALERRNGVLFLNPGSASQPRFGYPPSLVRLTVDGKMLDAHYVDLNQDRE